MKCQKNKKCKKFSRNHPAPVKRKWCTGCDKTRRDPNRRRASEHRRKIESAYHNQNNGKSRFSLREMEIMDAARAMEQELARLRKQLEIAREFIQMLDDHGHEDAEDALKRMEEVK